MSNSYFQYFFLLGGITFTVSIVAKAAMESGPLKDVINNEKHKATIAAIIGIGTANGVFFALKNIGGVDQKISQILSIFFGIIAIGILVYGLKHIKDFVMEEFS